MDNVLSALQIDQFINDGFIRVDHAFSPATAAAARDILWKDLGCDPHDPATWTKPVIRLGWYTQQPFLESANSPRLHAIYDQLVGKDRWEPRINMGTFPVRFPSPDDPGDTGWHVDASFAGSAPSNQGFADWRVNVKSKARALLMLFLFSDVSEHDAPARIRVGSHLDVARVLKPAGDEGLSFMELAGTLRTMPEHSEVLAIGPAGTVYLCHPFIVHAGQPHRGSEPRFLAQPPLGLKGEFDLESSEPAPVARAIQIALV
jgi:hypothetical protein